MKKRATMWHMLIEPPLQVTPQVEEKLLVKHPVSVGEVEQALFEDNPWQDKTRTGKFFLLAQTLAGRYLFVVLVRQGREHRLVTARDMEDRERNLYQRKKR